MHSRLAQAMLTSCWWKETVPVFSSSLLWIFLALCSISSFIGLVLNWLYETTCQKTKPGEKKNGQSLLLQGVDLTQLGFAQSQTSGKGLDCTVMAGGSGVGVCIERGISSKVLYLLGKIHHFSLRFSREGEWEWVVFLSDVFKLSFLPWRNTAAAASEELPLKGEVSICTLLFLSSSAETEMHLFGPL